MLFTNKENIKNSGFWHKNILPQFEAKYIEIKSKIFDQDTIDQTNYLEKEILFSTDKYKKNFSKSKYFLSIISVIFSIILLFIPFYWSFNWFKKLNNEKTKYQLEIKEKIKDKLLFHQKIIKSFDFDVFFNHFNGIIEYQHMGPIPNLLIDEIKSLTFFDLENTNESNTYLSSWGILDKNKIVIHNSNQSLIKYFATYTGSGTIYYTNSKGETESEVVYADYTHPAFRIEKSRKSYFFMSSCSNLEFYFENKSNSLLTKKFNKKNNYPPLENSEFDTKYNWIRNDDLQFRMLFTPYAQEMFLKEDNKSNSFKTLKWKKQNSFIYNEFENSNISLIWKNNLEKIIFYFLQDKKSTIESFSNDLFQSVVDYYYNLYQSLNYSWLTTLLPSEDHSLIINKVLDSKNNVNSQNWHLFFHNVLSEIFKEQIIQIHTECFNEIEKIELFNNVNNFVIYKAKMKGTSFRIDKKTTYITKFSSKGSINIPVEYNDYIPYNDYGYIYGCFLSKDNNLIFINDKFGIKNNIENPKMISILNQLVELECRIAIFNNVFAIYTKDQNNLDDKIKELINLF